MPKNLRTAFIFIFFGGGLLSFHAQGAEVLESAPRYSYQDAIRESVFVEMPLGGEKIAVDIIRPAETAQDLKAPVIMDASPYFERIGRGREGQKKTYDKNGEIIGFPLFYDNYFVPRGYAVVLVDVIGTNRSQGCPTVGGNSDIEGVIAVIDWLNSRAKAYDKNGREKVATWSTGKVGMIGKSFDGALGNGVAATGVDGLSTVVAICSISNWYDWVNPNGHPELAKSMIFMFDTVIAQRNEKKCSTQRASLLQGADNSRDYNSFWEERNYLNGGQNFKASMFMVHGFNDLNVRMNHLGKLWQVLSKNQVARKLWLSQSGHVDPFDFRREIWVKTLHRWFDFWLLNIENGIMDEPAVSIERTPGVWDNYEVWPDPQATHRDFFLATNEMGLDGQITAVPPPEGSEKSYTLDQNVYQFLKFLSKPLRESIRLSGTSRVTLVAKVDQEDANIGAIILDYGLNTVIKDNEKLSEKDCWGESSQADSACFFKTKNTTVDENSKLVSFGLLSAKHGQSLEQSHYLTPGQWYTFEFDIFPTDHVFKEAHQLGIVINSSSLFNRVPLTVTVDLAHTKITIPIKGKLDL